MNGQNLDYGRLAKVAAMGAISAIAADIAYNHYGSEIHDLLDQVLELVAQGQNSPRQPGPVGG